MLSNFFLQLMYSELLIKEIIYTNLIKEFDFIQNFLWNIENSKSKHKSSRVLRLWAVSSREMDLNLNTELGIIFRIHSHSFSDGIIQTVYSSNDISRSYTVCNHFYTCWSGVTPISMCLLWYWNKVWDLRGETT